ncbi:MAG: diacylglycerol/polyprenol kinase family protein [Promethearchaeia archaeon]
MSVEFAITLGDVIVYFIAVIYAALVLVVGDLGKRKFGLGSHFTRKIIHLFAGAAIWTVPYYPHPWVATLVALTFVIMLGLASTQRFSKFFAAMARHEDIEHGSVRGPFWYAVSITILTGFFTFTGQESIYFLAAAGIHIMMLGDGLSAPIGVKYGANSTRIIFGSRRSTHGCLALFIFGLIGALIAFWFFGIVNYGVFVKNGIVQWIPLVVLATIGATSATLIELVSPKGSDNVTVPLLSTAVMWVAAIAMGIL